MRDVLMVTGIPFRHCLDLISAFKQDSVKHCYADWSDLIDYCNRSAAPVGRFLLDLHGGSRHGYGPCDALCNTLQVLNHLQDCQDDYRKIGRVYLPQDWLREAGAVDAELDRPAATPALRRVLDRCLDGIDALLEEAAELPAGLASRRLALESGAILSIARSLSPIAAAARSAGTQGADGKAGLSVVLHARRGFNSIITTCAKARLSVQGRSLRPSRRSARGLSGNRVL